MIWLAWRQHRTSILAGLGALAALAAFLVITGLGMRNKFDSLGLSQCTVPTSMSCPEPSHQFDQLYDGYRLLIPLLLIVPALIGVFWGAPLVAREVEQGTHRLVWAQSITRRRWLLVKTAVLAVATLVVLTTATWLSTWWTEPIMAVKQQRFESGVFDLLGVAPIAYGIAALAIGITAGTFSRKLIPAIGLTLVAFLFVRVGVEFGLRPHYMQPVTASVAFPANADRPEFPTMPADIGWAMSLETVDANRRFISDGVGFEYRALVAACPELADETRSAPPNPKATAACIQRMGFHVVAVYHPEDRYWRFQITEAVIYLLLSGGLLATSVWWLRRRVS